MSSNPIVKEYTNPSTMTFNGKTYKYTGNLSDQLVGYNLQRVENLWFSCQNPTTCVQKWIDYQTFTVWESYKYDNLNSVTSGVYK